MNDIKNQNFKYSLKICKNKNGIRLFKICKYCNVANNIKNKRCLNCLKKI